MPLVKAIATAVARAGQSKYWPSETAASPLRIRSIPATAGLPAGNFTLEGRETWHAMRSKQWMDDALLQFQRTLREVRQIITKLGAGSQQDNNNSYTNQICQSI